MPKNTAARGYTNVILILNMKRFVHAGDQARFETARGSRALADALRDHWPAAAGDQKTFISIEEEVTREALKKKTEPDLMLTEQVGFATGIFNTRMLEEYTFPTYVLDKETITFPAALRTNFQFKTLFERVWERWDVYIRPTYTGFFVIRLTQRYQETTRPLIDLAQDILHLQESLDVVSARNWLKYNRERYVNEPETLAVKEKSVMALLDWMGASLEDGSALLYYPVQWKLAMETARFFVREIGKELALPGQSPIRLEEPDPNLSIPLHDSYIIHHFDKLLARPHMIKRGKSSSQPGSGMIEARVTDLHQSPRLRKALINMLEGSILTTPHELFEDEDQRRHHHEDSHFPDPRWSIVDSLMEKNCASWNDEFCVFDTRTAIIIPSEKSHDFELAVATVPSATLHVRYPRYWGAVERLVEFTIEIHIFAQLLEGVSFDLLTEIVDTVHRLRPQIIQGDILLDERIAGLITKAADLRKQAALAQSLSHPLMWGRAEYALEKSTLLLDLMGVPTTLEHVERNISSINSVVDQIDEWYLADLSEKSNDRAHYLTIFVTAASFLLTILILPSFWADIWNVLPEGRPVTWLYAAGIFGSIIALGLMWPAGLLLFRTLSKWEELKDLLDRLLNNKP